jgi:hypothetical protein
MAVGYPMCRQRFVRTVLTARGTPERRTALACRKAKGRTLKAAERRVENRSVVLLDDGGLISPNIACLSCHVTAKQTINRNPVVRVSGALWASTEMGGEKGFNPAKQVKGRKRHLMTDTLGLILFVPSARHLSQTVTVLSISFMKRRDDSRVCIPC